MKNIFISSIILFFAHHGYCQFNTIDGFGKVNGSSYPINKFEIKNSDSIILQHTEQEILSIKQNKDISTNIAFKKFYPPLKKMIPTSKYGYRIHPITKESKFHTGIDLKAYYEPVYNIAGGIITFSGYGNIEGNYVVINHGKVSSVYCHLSKIVCSKGQVIKAGEVIGVSGNTGRSTGPHLHFGLKWEEERLNPESLLRLLRW